MTSEKELLNRVKHGYLSQEAKIELLTEVADRLLARLEEINKNSNNEKSL